MFTVTYQDQSGSVLGSDMIKHSKLTRNGKEDELIKSVKNCNRILYKSSAGTLTRTLELCTRPLSLEHRCLREAHVLAGEILSCFLSNG